MERKESTPRPDWQSRVHSQGLTFHTDPTGTYWDESVYYQFSQQRVRAVEDATSALYAMTLRACDRVVSDEKLLRQFCGDSRELCAYVEDSWRNKDPSLYGRFDLSFEGEDPKLLEFNADTPTTLVEASVAQWFWFQDKFGSDEKYDQFNSIHQNLISQWAEVASKCETGSKFHLSCVNDHEEDFRTVNYLLDVAVQAGIDASSLFISDVGWNQEKECFVDLKEEPITNLFKLYPWEWLTHEDFSTQLLQSKNKLSIVEPAWKMILSNKNILPLLWELFPNHPNLLPCYFEKDLDKLGGKYVKKPVLGREGNNVSIVLGEEGTKWKTDGAYGNEGFIYQKVCLLPEFSGHNTLVGSWIVGDKASGIGIREDSDPITKDSSRFVPHVYTLD